MKKIFAKKWLVGLLVIILIAVGFFGYQFFKKDTVPAMAQAATATVERGDIQVYVSGSGTITAEREMVTATQGGTVKTIHFSEGDQVKKDQVLVSFEEEDVNEQIITEQLNLERKMMDLQEAQVNEQNLLENLAITAPESGYLIDLDVEVGDDVQPGTVICSIQDVNTQKITAPFNGAQINRIKPGQEANVFLYSSLSTIKGTVTEVDTIGRVAQGNALLFDVTVELRGYQAIEAGSDGQITVVTTSGDITSIDKGAITPAPLVEIKAKTSGTVSKILISKQQAVEKGQLLVQLASDSNSVANAKKKIELEIEQINREIQSLEEEQAAYEPILSPIDGEVVTSNMVAGSKVNPGQEIVEIVNYDELSLVIPVDELDIAKVKVGQKAEVTVDALPDKKISGEVIEIAKEGKAENGVSIFDVTIRLAKAEGLKAGMSADANILAEQKQNVLLLPIEAVQQSQQGRKFVLLAPQSTDEDKPAADNQRNRQMKPVEVGIHNENMIEIMNGLTEGEQVVIPMATSNRQGTNFRSGGLGGLGGFSGGGSRPQGQEGSGSGGGNTNRGSNSGGGR